METSDTNIVFPEPLDRGLCLARSTRAEEVAVSQEVPLTEVVDSGCARPPLAPRSVGGRAMFCTRFVRSDLQHPGAERSYRCCVTTPERLAYAEAWRARRQTGDDSPEVLLVELRAHEVAAVWTDPESELHAWPFACWQRGVGPSRLPFGSDEEGSLLSPRGREGVPRDPKAVPLRSAVLGEDPRSPWRCLSAAVVLATLVQEV